MSELAVSGCTVKITSGQTAISITIITSPSSDISVNSKGVYFGDIDVTLIAVTQGSFVCPEATLTIKGTASNVLEIAGSKKAVQKNDSATDTFTFTDPSTLVTKDLTVTIQITDAGQTDVIAS